MYKASNFEFEWKERCQSYSYSAYEWSAGIMSSVLNHVVGGYRISSVKFHMHVTIIGLFGYCAFRPWVVWSPRKSDTCLTGNPKTAIKGLRSRAAPAALTVTMRLGDRSGDVLAQSVCLSRVWKNTPTKSAPQLCSLNFNTGGEFSAPEKHYLAGIKL